MKIYPRLTAKSLFSDVDKSSSDVAYFIIFPYETTTKKNNRRLIELRRKSQNKWEKVSRSKKAEKYRISFLDDPLTYYLALSAKYLGLKLSYQVDYVSSWD